MRVSSSRGKSIGTAQVPVRRFGTVPPLPEEPAFLEFEEEEEEEKAPRGRTIGERGALAVWMGAAVVAVVAGVLLYA